jgi:preprotein translocase subunit YajC
MPLNLILLQAGGGAPGPLGCGGGSSAGTIGMLVIMFAVFYFMLIRPQQKKQREHQEMLKNLKKGDEVVTTGGIVGRISGLTDAYATLEVQEKVRIKVVRSHITGRTQNTSSGSETRPQA